MATREEQNHPNKCEECSEVEPSKEALDEHLKLHDCMVCGKFVRQETKYDEHNECVESGKVAACDFCWRTSLSKYEAAHHDEIEHAHIAICPPKLD